MYLHVLLKVKRNHGKVLTPYPLQIPYKKNGLDVQNVEDWPTDKINYVPNELKDKLVPALQAPWKKFHANLEK